MKHLGMWRARTPSPERGWAGDADFDEEAAEAAFLDAVGGVASIPIDRLISFLAFNNASEAGGDAERNGEGALPPNHPDLLVVDLRPHREFLSSHLPGAINVALPSIFAKRIRRNPRATKFALDAFVVAGKANLELWRANLSSSERPTVLLVDTEMGPPSLDSAGWVLAMLLARNVHSLCRASEEFSERQRSPSPDNKAQPSPPHRGPMVPRLEITITRSPSPDRPPLPEADIVLTFLDPGFSALLAHPSGRPFLTSGAADDAPEPATPLSSTTMVASPSPSPSPLTLASSPRGSKDSVSGSKESIGSSGTANEDGGKLERSASFTARARLANSLLTINTARTLRRTRSTSSKDPKHATSNRNTEGEASLGSNSTLGSQQLSPPQSTVTLHTSPNSGTATPSSSEPLDPISEILPNLFLGSDELDHDELKDKGITHVLNVAGEVEDDLPDDIVAHKIGIRDDGSIDITAELREGVDWIGSALADPDAKVLVHCARGISRSATFLLAYLISGLRIPLKEAYELARKGRRVMPNLGFWLLLGDWEAAELGGTRGSESRLKGAEQ